MSTIQKWSGREARALREALRLGVRAFAAHLGVGERTITKWEAGGSSVCPRPEMQAALDTALQRADDGVKARFELALRGATIQPAPPMDPDFPVPEPPGVERVPQPVLDQLEQLRRGLTEAMTESAMSEASVEDWEQAALRHGYATRDRPAGALLVDLAADLVDLQHALNRCRSSASLRRLTRVTAQMAGLMCLTLIKLDERTAFRRWARTARVAADEADDPEVRSWVRAQEAYGHFYSGDLADAITVARQAQTLAGDRPCVGVPLAAALEARAQALCGRRTETRAALDRAETAFSRLDGEAVIPSAFGYNEAQLRFHEGNAYTHLRDTPAACAAQDQALALYPEGDYMDPALIRLDRASCLAHDGDTTAAMHCATDALTRLTEPQSTGLISLRAHQILDALPRKMQSLRAVREFRDLLMLPTARTEDDR